MSNIFIDGKEYIFAIEAGKIKNGKSIKLTLNVGEISVDLGIFKINDEIICISNVCPHNHESRLHEGYVEEFIVHCPLHGWSFDLKTGKNTENSSKLEIFNSKIIDSKIYIEKPQARVPKWML